MNVHNRGSEREAAEANVRVCIESIAQNRGTTIDTVSGVAIAQALLAIHDTLETIAGALATPIPPPFGACPSVLEIPASRDQEDHLICQYLNGHDGLHRSDDGDVRWTSDAENAHTIGVDR